MASVALREFLLVAERGKQPLDAAIQRLHDAAQTDPEVVRMLLDVHPQCAPLLQVWPSETGKQSRYEARESVALYLDLLEQMLRIQQPANASATALKIIRDHSAHLEKLLTWSDKPLIEYRVLCLLRAVASVNAATARELVRIFNFQSAAFTKQAKRRMKLPVEAVEPGQEEDADDASEDEESAPVKAVVEPPFQIRQAYVDLVLTLASSEDRNVHRFVLKEGGLVASLFQSIGGDPGRLVTLVLDRIDRLVLRDEQVDVRGRMAIFNSAAIHELVELAGVEDAGIAEPAAKLLHHLFLEEGALYHVSAAQSIRVFVTKRGAGTSAEEVADESASNSLETRRIAARTIRAAISGISLQCYVRSAAAQKFVNSLLAAHPALLGEYLSTLAPPLEPRAGYRWFSVASTLQQLLRCPLDAAIDELKQDVVAYSAELVVSRVVCPISCRKELSRGLQHSSLLVVYACLGLIEAVLRRFQKLAQVFSATNIEQDLQLELRSILPSPETLLSLLTKLRAMIDQHALLYTRALTVLRMFMECLPQAAREIKADFSKLVPWNAFEGDFQSPMQRTLVGEILALLLVIDNRQLRLLFTSRSKESSDPAASSSSSKMMQTIRLFMTAPNRLLRELSKRVLQRVFANLQVFGTDELGERGLSPQEEIAVWLDGLQGGTRETAVLVEHLLQQLVNDPFMIFQQAGNGAEVGSGASPATRALLSVVQRSNGHNNESHVEPAITAFGQSSAVLAFVTRVSFAVLAGSQHPHKFATMISSCTSKEEDDTSDKKSRKRQRLDDSLPTRHLDAFTCLEVVCHCLLSHDRPSATLARAVTKKEWPDEADADLSSLDPVEFVAHVKRKAPKSKSMKHLQHYLEARLDIDLVDMLDQARTTKMSATFANLPLHLLSRHAVFLIALRRPQDQIEATLAALHKAVATKESIPNADAAAVCEHLLLCYKLQDRIVLDDHVWMQLDGILLRIMIEQASHPRSISVKWHRIFRTLVAPTEQPQLVQHHQARLFATALCARLVWGQQANGTIAGHQDAVFRIAPTVSSAILGHQLPSRVRFAVLAKLLATHRNVTKSGTMSAMIVTVCLRGMNDLRKADVDGLVNKGVCSRLRAVLANMVESESLAVVSTGIHMFVLVGGATNSRDREQLVVSPSWSAWLARGILESTVHDFAAVVKTLLRLRVCMVASDFGNLVDQSIPLVKGDKQAMLIAVAALTHPALRTQSSPVEAQRVKLLPAYVCDLLDESGSEEERSLRLAVVRDQILHSEMPETIQKKLRAFATEHAHGMSLSGCAASTLLLLTRHHASIHIASAPLVRFVVRSSLLCLTNTEDTASSTIADALLAVTEELLQSMPPARRLEAAKPMEAILQKAMLRQPPASNIAFILFARLSLVILRGAADGKHAKNSDFDAAGHLEWLLDSEWFASSLVDPATGIDILRLVECLLQRGAPYSRQLFEGLLSTYSMSLSPIDRMVRTLLARFEASSSLSLASYGYRFGPHLNVGERVEGVAKAKDLVEDSAWIVSGALEPMRIRATIEHFPLERTIAVDLDSKDSAMLDEPSDASKQEDLDGGQATCEWSEQAAVVYDPSYWLPMLAHALTSSELPIAGIVQQGLLGLAIRATSSRQADIRAYAYGVLAHVFEVLSADPPSFKPGRQVHLLLQVLRAALREPTPRLSSVLTVFLNDALSILTRPAHAMFAPVNQFLLAHAELDCLDVPMFFALFHSHAAHTAKQERAWVLHTLRRSIVDDDDVSLLLKKHVPSMLLSFFASELADEHTQSLVVSILKALLRTKMGSAYLLGKSAFLAWLAAQFDRSPTYTIKVVLSLRDVLVQTMQADWWMTADRSARQAQSILAASCFMVSVTSLEQRVVASESHAIAMAQLAERVLTRAFRGCTVVTLTTAVRIASPPLVGTPDGSSDTASSSIALACLEALLRPEHLLSHADFDSRRYPEWAQLLAQAARVLAVLLQMRGLRLQERAEQVQSEMLDVLAQAPVLAAMVRGLLCDDLVASAALS